MEAKFKILLIGKSGVGKSCVLNSFTTSDYEMVQAPTIGVDFKVKEISINNDKIKLGIWDTAGMERYRVMTPSFYRGVQGVILVYDVTDRGSLNDLNSWISELQTYADKSNIVGLVLGNKIDKPRAVSTEDGRIFAQRYRMMFLESSAKTGEGVNFAFEELARKVYETPGLWEYENAEPAPSPTQNQQNCCSGYIW
ncbi:ras-related protein Rab-18-like [Arctopsyche grandis]|uniref:ras-related protein Rab-18-like n=1 Tax=Arctopsyche grandis TaxID=121162 RepID=UPI00406D89BC